MIRSMVFSVIIMMIPANCLADGRLERCESYRHDVQTILAYHGVSVEYYYLMVAESGCRIGSVSNRGAVGFWQMTKATMQHYGCTRADDVICQTHAAAKYIKHLSKRFNDDDIIFAWNMGGTNFKRIGKPTKQALGLLKTFKKLSQMGAGTTD